MKVILCSDGGPVEFAGTGTAAGDVFEFAVTHVLVPGVVSCLMVP